MPVCAPNAPDAATLVLAQTLADQYATLPQVEAVALAGSQTFGARDHDSDLDLYVYVSEALPVACRAAIIRSRAIRMQLDNHYWEVGDEWIERDSGMVVDVKLRPTAWIEAQLARVLVHHQASIGGSTCAWQTILTAHICYDRRDWLRTLQNTVRVPYPEALRHAIIAKNYPLLRQAISGYLPQLTHALRRSDSISIYTLVAGLLASYFDIVFALNRLPHPGDKRQLASAQTQCTQLPIGMQEHVQTVMQMSASADPAFLSAVERLIDGVDRLVIGEPILLIRPELGES
jgi:hypothetical protein